VTAADFTLHDLGVDEFDTWRHLFGRYCEFYETDCPDEKAQTVWGWLHDPTHPEEGRFVCQSGTIIGLLHFRAAPLTLTGTDVGFIDDLYIDPAARGERAGEFVAQQVQQIARERGWPSVQWLTADDNYRGRTLYDRIGKRTMWITYEMDLD
jgi:ribosomal protein S18 acetylase RimI-like enzyme